MTDLRMLTLSGLLADLQQMIATGTDPDSVVILSKDAEGNGFSPIAAEDAYGTPVVDFSVGYYRPESTWAGDFWAPGSPDDDDFDDDPRTVSPNDVKAVVLWPTN
ncbi:hypothetical protein [Frankia sp. AgW1.1]|uniref:hypothetical protein n=1 Tax=Frankia sp. AgW1.1 TaxID=1836971 RepID=UPI00193122F2|nr:hypothetical protein [Frankia sp. AgW1.1]MBL7494378.1 hypothetical protein [Frankia sp. AgW1.1]